MKVGDRVVCVKGHSDPICPLKVNSIYIILNVYACKCGAISFDVGITIPSGDNMVCNCDRNMHTNIWFIGSSKFRPLQYNSATEDLIKEIVEERLDIKEPQKEKA